jgi:hypothetical protein
MEDLSKLEKIENIYREYDFFKRVNKYWSFHTEYNAEALKLACQLNRQDTVLSIQYKIWNIFYKSYPVKSPHLNVKIYTNNPIIDKIGMPENILKWLKK